MRRPNVLLITADQWRGDCLSIAGHPHVSTPNLDTLARSGTRFCAHYAGSTPCAPARASLYTGLYPMNHRVVSNGTPLDTRHDNLAHLARRAGYEPVLFGHTDAAADPRQLDAADPRLADYEGVLDGFSVRTLLDESELTWRSWLHERGVEDAFGAALHEPPLQYDQTQTQSAFLVDEFNRWVLERCHATAKGNATEIDFDTDRRKGTGAGKSTGTGSGTRDDRARRPPPWFAHVSLIRPHPPFVVPPPYDSMVGPERVALPGAPSDVSPLLAHPYLRYVLRDQCKSTYTPGETGLASDWSLPERQAMAAIYFGMVTEVDAQLGRLFARLRALELWDDTLIIVTSDHGEMLGQHGLFGKFGFFDACYHIPLIIKDAVSREGDASHAQSRASAGGRIEAFTEAVDILPTLADRLGVGLGNPTDGHSLLPWLSQDPPLQWRQQVHWEHDFRDSVRRRPGAEGWPANQCNLSVRRSCDHKYVHFGSSELPPLLFDLQTDPHETNDLSAHPDWQTRRLASAEGLLRWRARHQDQTLANRWTRDSE